MRTLPAERDRGRRLAGPRRGGRRSVLAASARPGAQGTPPGWGRTPPPFAVDYRRKVAANRHARVRFRDCLQRRVWTGPRLASPCPDESPVGADRRAAATAAPILGRRPAGFATCACSARRTSPTTRVPRRRRLLRGDFIRYALRPRGRPRAVVQGSFAIRTASSRPGRSGRVPHLELARRSAARRQRRALHADVRPPGRSATARGRTGRRGRSPRRVVVEHRRDRVRLQTFFDSSRSRSSVLKSELPPTLSCIVGRGGRRAPGEA